MRWLLLEGSDQTHWSQAQSAREASKVLQISRHHHSTASQLFTLGDNRAGNDASGVLIGSNKMIPVSHLLNVALIETVVVSGDERLLNHY